MKKLPSKKEPNPKILKEETIHSITIKLTNGTVFVISPDELAVKNKSVKRYLNSRA